MRGWIKFPCLYSFGILVEGAWVKLRYDKIGVELRRCHLIRAVFPVTPFEVKFINLDKFCSKEKRTFRNDKR